MGFEIGFYLVELGVEAETAFAIGAAVEGAAITVGKLVVLSAVSQALQKKAATNSGSGAIGSQGRNVSVRQAISSWEIVAGRIRKGGTYTFIHQSTDEAYLHMIITLTGHVSESIDEVWFDDNVLSLNGNGYDTSRYIRSDTVWGPSTFGFDPNFTVPDFASAIDVQGYVSTDIDGIAQSGVMTDVSPAAPAAANEYKRVGNVYTFFAGYPISSNIIPTINYNRAFVRIKTSMGDEAGQPFPDLVTESEGKWTDAHRQTGHTKIYVRLQANRTLFPSGVPNITVVMKGAKITNRRTSVTAYSNNATDWVTNYFTDTRYGMRADYTNEFDNTDQNIAANICDEDVALLAGGTEKRYAVDGVFLTSERPSDIITRLLAAMAGKAVNAGDKWHIFAGAYITPSLTLDEGDLVGEINAQSIIPRRDLCNGVKGIFVDPTKNWQPNDFPPISSSVALAEDGERNWRDIDLSAFGISHTRCQRLAKIELLRTRFGKSFSAPFKLTAWQTVTGGSFMMSMAPLGWVSRPNEIVSSKLVCEGDKNTGQSRLTVELLARQTDPAIYAWSSAEEQSLSVDPGTNLPDPVIMTAPTGVAAFSGTNELLVASDGTVITRVRLIWDPPTNPFVLKGGRLMIQFRKAATILNWQDAPPATEPKQGQGYIDYLEDGVNYDIRVAFQNFLGGQSEWTQILHFVIGKSAKPDDVGALTFVDPILSWPPNTEPDLAGYIVKYQPSASNNWNTALPAHEQGFITPTKLDIGRIIGDSTRFLVKAVDTSGNESLNATTIVGDLRPPTPSSFLISVQPDGTREFTWATTTPPSDLDGIRIRYFLGTTSDWTAMTPLHTGILKASPFETNQLAAGTYTFAAKNVDQASNESAAAIFITTVTIADPRVAGAVEDVKEEPTWTGTKTDCHLDGATGWLVADGSGTWATAATWAAMDAWVITPKSPITYVRQIDAGVVTKFTPLVTTFVDGSQTIEEQHSNDNVTYSSYATVGPPVTARYIRIKVVVTGSFPKIKAMRTILSAQLITEIIEDLATSSLTGAYDLGVGNVRLPITKPFSLIKKVDVTLQSVGAGWSWELIDKNTATGPQIKIYNASNALADATIDATVIGV